MTKAKSTKSCPVETYARNVLDGKIVAGRLVRLACKRHLRDLEEGPKRGLQWKATAAAKTIEFFSFLRLPSKDDPEGKPFKLNPFQEFIVGSLFGWKAEDGYRRFRTAYIEQGKGSGKSPIAAGIGLIGLVADGEPSAEIYAAATKLEQANILFRDAKAMVNASPALKSRLDVGLYNIACEKTNSFFRPISSEKRGLDGPRPHMALLDEIHEHPDAVVVDKVRAGTKSRKQALIVEITNAGYDRHSVCWNHREFSVQVLEGIIENDSWFAYVCQLDACDACRDEGKTFPTDGCPDCDDWKDEKVWEKVNPGIDTILPRKYLREQAAEAIGMPAKENIVKRLNFCIWTETDIRAIPMDKWDACGQSAGGPADPVFWRKSAIERLRGESCWGGLDLGSTADLTALVLLFRELDDAGKEMYTILPYFWVPRETARQRSRKDRVPYETWIKQGFITATEGNGTDYDKVRRDINELANTFGLQCLEVDRLFQGAQLCSQLQGDGINLEAFGQGFMSMAAPTKRFLELIVGEQLQHGNNPCLRWQASNLSTETDAAGNLKPSKKKSTERIDGIVSCIMAVGKAMTEPETGSYYDHNPVQFWGK